MTLASLGLIFLSHYMGIIITYHSRCQEIPFRNHIFEAPNLVPVHRVSDEYWFLLLAPYCLPLPSTRFSPHVPCKLGSLIKHRGGFSQLLSNCESAAPERRV